MTTEKKPKRAVNPAAGYGKVAVLMGGRTGTKSRGPALRGCDRGGAHSGRLAGVYRSANGV